MNWIKNPKASYSVLLLLPVPLFLLFFLDSTGKRLFLVFGRPLSSFDKTIDAMGLDLLFFLGIETGLLKRPVVIVFWRFIRGADLLAILNQANLLPKDPLLLRKIAARKRRVKEKENVKRLRILVQSEASNGWLNPFSLVLFSLSRISVLSC